MIIRGRDLATPWLALAQAWAIIAGALMIAVPAWVRL